MASKTRRLDALQGRGHGLSRPSLALGLYRRVGDGWHGWDWRNRRHLWLNRDRTWLSARARSNRVGPLGDELGTACLHHLVQRVVGEFDIQACFGRNLRRLALKFHWPFEL